MATDPCLVGYARIAKGDDPPDTPQVRALKAAGCERVVDESVSGGRWERPRLRALIRELRGGDIVVVWKLDQLSPNLKDLLYVLEKIEAAGAGFRSLAEGIDTTTSAGRMMMQMVGALAEFERARTRERTSAGLALARSEGRIGGRPKKLTPKKRLEIARTVLSGHKSAAEMARLYGISQPTVSRIVAEHRDTIPGA